MPCTLLLLCAHGELLLPRIPNPFFPALSRKILTKTRMSLSSGLWQIYCPSIHLSILPSVHLPIFLTPIGSHDMRSLGPPTFSVSFLYLLYGTQCWACRCSLNDVEGSGKVVGKSHISSFHKRSLAGDWENSPFSIVHPVSILAGH